jgi:hypothetical protein
LTAQGPASTDPVPQLMGTCIFRANLRKVAVVTRTARQALRIVWAQQHERLQT